MGIASDVKKCLKWAFEVGEKSEEGKKEKFAARRAIVKTKVAGVMNQRG